MRKPHLRVGLCALFRAKLAIKIVSVAQSKPPSVIVSYRVENFFRKIFVYTLNVYTFVWSFIYLNP